MRQILAPNLSCTQKKVFLSCIKMLSHDDANTSLKEWERIFPIGVTQTYRGSIAFVKQLATVALSQITFAKKIFAEENFKEHDFGGIPLRILKNTCEDELAQEASSALVNSFDALNKRYLKDLVLCLYDGEVEPDNLVETYSLSFTYNPAGVTLGLRGEGARSAAEACVRDRTQSLLNTCIEYGSARERSPLRPDKPYNIIIRHYYNESAPEDYQAPGFSRPRAEGGVAAALESSVRLARVATGYHTVRMHTYRRPDLLKQELEDDKECTPAIPTFTEEEIDDIRNVMCQEQELAVRCECGLVDAAEPMLTCSNCSTRQHAACYGALGVLPPAAHCCVRCARAGCGPVSSQLAFFTDQPKKLRGLCIYRRILVWLRGRRTVCARDLSTTFRLTEPEHAHKLMVVLHQNYVLRAAEGEQEIDHNQLQIQIQNELRSNFNENTVVERLVAESQSQTEVDPVQEALRPAERSTLRAAAGAPELPYTPPEPITQDSTLEKYRKAVSFTDDIEEELPLSGTHNPVPITQTGERVTKRKADFEIPPAKSRLATK